MEPYLAEVRMFGGNFAPRSWAFCNGQLLPINQNQALFSLIGTIYGGDGRTSFALPDLRGRVPVGPGNGPGLSSRREGERLGQEVHTLNVLEMPSHSHNGTGHQVVAGAGIGGNLPPAGNVASNNNTFFQQGTPSEKFKAGTVAGTSSLTGGGQSHENRMPFIAVNYIIAIQGLFPSRS